MHQNAGADFLFLLLRLSVIYDILNKNGEGAATPSQIAWHLFCQTQPMALRLPDRNKLPCQAVMKRRLFYDGL